jgi:hypothetical protein
MSEVTGEQKRCHNRRILSLFWDVSATISSRIDEYNHFPA